MSMSENTHWACKECLINPICARVCDEANTYHPFCKACPFYLKPTCYHRHTNYYFTEHDVEELKRNPRKASCLILQSMLYHYEKVEYIIKKEEENTNIISQVTDLLKKEKEKSDLWNL